MSEAFLIVIWLLAGAALGAAFFASLRLAVSLYGSGRALYAVPLHLARVAVAVAAFWYASTFGAVPLLAALGGFLIARVVMTRAAVAREKVTP